MSNVTTGNKLVNEILEIAFQDRQQSQEWYKASLFDTVEHPEQQNLSLDHTNLSESINLEEVLYNRWWEIYECAPYYKINGEPQLPKRERDAWIQLSKEMLCLNSNKN